MKNIWKMAASFSLSAAALVCTATANAESSKEADQAFNWTREHAKFYQEQRRAEFFGNYTTAPADKLDNDDPDATTRIVGGTFAGASDNPHQVALALKKHTE